MGPGRARAAVVLLAALALASLSTSARASRYIPMEQQTNAGGALAFAIETNLGAAQSFVPTASFTLTRIAAFVQDSGKSDALTILIVPDAGGRPDVATVLATASNDTSPAFAWSNFTLTPSVSVTGGTRYWIVADEAGGAGEGYLWRYENLDAYSRGNASTASGATWTTQPGDMAFVVYGWTPAAVAVTAVADRQTVAGGEPLSFTIQLTNTGTEDATSVWVNATLDARLRPVTAGPGPVSISGGVVTFRPSSVPLGTTILRINATAVGILQENASIVTPVTAEFFDGVGRQGLATAALVQTRAPMVTATMALTKTEADRGDLVTFEVTLRNRGTATAHDVWLNETLHPALTYLNDTAVSPPTRDGEHQSWHFLDVAPGSRRFNITTQVDPLATGDTVVANFLSVGFTDPAGDGLLPGKSNTAVFPVIGAGGDLGGAGSNPWLWGSFAISASVVGGTYLGIARRRLRTEEIFLVHQSGVLLVHMSKSMKADLDSDILSGMFTAIMNFVRDAFHYNAQQELTGLDLGQHHVHVRKGAYTYLALVHTGKRTRWLQQTATRAIVDIESEYGAMLSDWNGDTRTLVGVREILKGYFLSPTGPSRSMQRLRALLFRGGTFKPMRPL